MEIRGKITIFPEHKEGAKGKFTICKGTISSKQDDGSYLNKSVEVKFDREKFPMEKLNELDDSKCYELEVESGWLVVDGYVKEDKQINSINLYVKDGKLNKVKDKAEAKKNSNLPF